MKKWQKPKLTCIERTLYRKTEQIHIKTKRVGDRDRRKFNFVNLMKNDNRNRIFLIF